MFHFTGSIVEELKKLILDKLELDYDNDIEIEIQESAGK
jgi:hypothetical protein